MTTRTVLVHLPLALVLTVAGGCSKPSDGSQPKGARSEGVPVSVATVVVVPMDRTLPVVGTLFAKDEATIAARVEGQVEKTLVDFGDRVTNGQVLARIDTASYEALTRQAAANLAKAEASAANAEQDLKRVRDLQRDKIASASEFDKATAAAEQAKAEVKAAAAAEAITRLNLERSQVQAPFDGAVAERIASAGDYMKTGQSLFRLVNDGVLKFIVQVPERYAAQVRKEQLMRFTVDAWPGEVFEGRVYLISPAVNPGPRSFNIGALVPNGERRLKSSTFGRGELILEKAVPTPVIPLEAVVSFAGVMKVFVIENGVARARQIEVGRVNDSKQEVLSGLKAGETVAKSGQSKLYDGVPVRLRDGNPKAETRAPKE
jgi:membrane fusion protein (multidrug efflux system)